MAGPARLARFVGFSTFAVNFLPDDPVGHVRQVTPKRILQMPEFWPWDPIDEAARRLHHYRAAMLAAVPLGSKPIAPTESAKELHGPRIRNSEFRLDGGLGFGGVSQPFPDSVGSGSGSGLLSRRRCADKQSLDLPQFFAKFRFIGHWLAVESQQVIPV